MAISPTAFGKIDRLVDGELSAGERRELLRDLESNPEAWRNCALAFVEAQVLRESFGELLSESASSTLR